MKAIETRAIQEWRYSVSDVIFEGVGDMEVPDEYQQIYTEYCAEIDILPLPTQMWRSAMPEYKNVMLAKARHKAYTRSLLCSNDSEKIQAAENAMLIQLGRYYESMQHEDHVRECRKNLEKARKEGKKWARLQQ